MDLSQKAKDANLELQKYYVFYPDFPKKGINFWDVFALTKNQHAFDLLHIIMEEYAKSCEHRIEVVVGLEARGFLFGPLLARMFNCSFTAIRKKGKLPGEVLEEKYALEYQEDIVQIQKDSIRLGQRVLIFDDCVATGGTLSAAYNLVRKLGGDVVDCMVLYKIRDVETHTKFPVTVLLQ